MNRNIDRTSFWRNPKNRVILIPPALCWWWACWPFLPGRNATFQNKRSEESTLVMQSVLDTVAVEAYFRDDFKRRDLHRQFAKFYTDRDYRLAWSTLKKPLPLADSLFNALQDASREGLQPDDYNIKELKQMRDSVFQRSMLKIKYKRPDLLRLVQLDFQLTAAYLTYASHLGTGRINPNKVDETWMINPQRNADLAKNLEKALKSRTHRQGAARPAAASRRLPRTARATGRYHQIQQQGGWPAVEASPSYRPGQSGAAVAALRRRLALTGDLPKAAGPTRPFSTTPWCRP
jgi:murein L,D-transpeptidase YcbB/YkuD